MTTLPCTSIPTITSPAQTITVCKEATDTPVTVSFQLTNYQIGDQVTSLTLAQGSSSTSISASCTTSLNSNLLTISCPRSVLGSSTSTQEYTLTVTVSRGNIGVGSSSTSSGACSGSAAATFQVSTCSTSTGGGGNTGPPSTGGSSSPPTGPKATGSGSAYARSGISRAAKCFRSALGCGNWGWYNAPGQSSFTDSAKSVVGAGDGDCTGGSVVGEVTATCSATTKALTLTVNNTPGATSTSDPSKYGRHFYVSCNNPSQCTPPRFGGVDRGSPASVSNGVVSYNMPWGSSTAGIWPNAAGSYYGSVRVFLGNFCSCSNVKWVVHQSGPTFYSTS